MPPNIFWLTYYVGTVFASSWGPVAFMSVWSDRITERAAYWGIISGFAGNVILRLIDTLGWVDLPSYLNPILIGGVISLVVVLWVSRLGSVTDTERARRLALHSLPADERDTEQTKKTQRAAIGVAVLGVFVSTVLIVFYVLPYQSATGTLRDGNRLDWLSGEAILSLVWAVLFVPWGVAAYKLIGRSYATDEHREP
jgi:sodium/pantothenate symporter